MTAHWRSVLFVPADRPDLAAKAPRCQPGAVVLDLEDAVPPDGKAAARAGLADIVPALSAEARVFVRVNPPGSPWFAEDAAALPEGLAGVVVPKLATPRQLSDVAQAVQGAPVVAGLETVQGVADARQLLRTPALEVIVAAYFGAEDFIADLGGVRTAANAEVVHPRAAVSMATRLAGIPALDMVTIDFGDDDRFRREAAEARALGYAGKLCIHPRQVALANEAFLPSAAEVAWASRLLEAFGAAEGRTIAFEGLMVDEVVAARARAILAATDDPD
jgi:citrate lyase subunit beta/citryl-CoA lyase